MELKLYFVKTIQDKMNLDLDKLARILIEDNIDMLLENFEIDPGNYLSSITDKADEIMECEDDNIPKISEELKAYLLSLCRK